MTRSRNGWRTVAWCVVALAVVAVPALADDGAIQNGVDLWATAGELSFSSFDSDPIPADFFCPGSEPFSGKVVFRGEPLVTEPAGSLGAIDTIVHRLDDAAFDADEIARTRIRLLALSLVAVEPIATSCGGYDVAVALAAEQPVTEMKIYRTQQFGGVYRAPLALDVELTFRPVAGNPHPGRTLVRRVDLGPAPHSVWSYRIAEAEAPVSVDTDGDRVADAPLPPQGNFLAGVSPSADGPRRGRIEFAAERVPTCPPPLCPYYTCHCTPWDDDPTYNEPNGDCESDHLHCTWVCAELPGQMCMSVEEL